MASVAAGHRIGTYADARINFMDRFFHKLKGAAIVIDHGAWIILIDHFRLNLMLFGNLGNDFNTFIRFPDGG